ncbi:MAG: hypothetical protein RLZZ385_98 [Pseudomonadota bacterium]|jgi:hypothetical protein
MTDKTTDNHWLTRPATVRKLWIGFSVVLILLVAAQYVIPMKGSFPLSDGFGFAAWFGFGSCVAMVLVARLLGWLLKRPESYYDGSAADAGEASGDKETRHD